MNICFYFTFCAVSHFFQNSNIVDMKNVSILDSMIGYNRPILQFIYVFYLMLVLDSFLITAQTFLCKTLSPILVIGYVNIIFRFLYCEIAFNLIKTLIDLLFKSKQLCLYLYICTSFYQQFLRL